MKQIEWYNYRNIIKGINQPQQGKKNFQQFKQHISVIIKQQSEAVK